MGLFTNKCIFCKGKDSFLKESFSWGIYDQTYFYHDKCLKERIYKPEMYNNHQVDIALDIIAREKEEYSKKHIRQKQINDAIKLLEQ